MYSIFFSVVGWFFVFVFKVMSHLPSKTHFIEKLKHDVFIFKFCLQQSSFNLSNVTKNSRVSPIRKYIYPIYIYIFFSFRPVKNTSANKLSVYQ